MKLTILFLTINYKTKMMLITMSEMPVEFKTQLFMLKFIGPFIMQGIGIMMCKTVWQHDDVFMYKPLQW